MMGGVGDRPLRPPKRGGSPLAGMGKTQVFVASAGPLGGNELGVFKGQNEDLGDKMRVDVGGRRGQITRSLGGEVLEFHAQRDGKALADAGAGSHFLPFGKMVLVAG